MKELAVQQQVKNLVVEAQLAEDRVTAANAQLVDLQRRLQQLESEFSLETARLRKEQHETLTRDKEKLTAELAEIREQIETAQNEVVEAHDLMLKYSKKGALLNIKIQNLNKDVDMLTIDKETLLIRTNNLRNDINSQNNRLTSLQTDVSVAETAKNQLNLALDDFETSKDILLTDIGNLETKRDELQSENQTIETEIDGKIRTKKIELEELRRYEKTTRENLAGRGLALDDREKNVTIRERKVDMAEQTIQNNAEYLEL